MEKKRIIVFFTPSLEIGGTERVVSTLSNHFCNNAWIEVHVILCSDKPVFYELDNRIKLHIPAFNYRNFKRAVFTLKLMWFLRLKASFIKPDALISFGGKYNSFSIIALAGTKIPVFISERSRPGLSYGFFLDWLNPMIYRFSDGIIAQTKQAVDFTFKRTKHKNIKLIGNPIKTGNSLVFNRQKVILNVGRFIKSKNQAHLIHIFADIDTTDWQLWFIGDGPTLEECKSLVSEFNLNGKILFLGNQTNIDSWYAKAAIFAFTSESEGFPNALGEAMAAGCACVSYDCIAGPSDLIDNGNNGFLIPLNDKSLFKYRLNQMMQPEFDLNKMSMAAIESIKNFSIDVISRKTLNFLLKNGD